MAKSAPKAKRPTKKEVRAERRSSRRSGNVTEITPGVSPELDERRRQPTRLSYKTQAQYHYMDSIRKNILTIGDGPAGTGKTFVCTKFACEELEASRISKIIVTRPAIEAADEQMGFLPGTLEEKFAPYFQPFREIFVEHFGASHLDNLMKRGRIEVAPMAYIRGLTFRDAFIILDEAQNTSPKQMKLFLTRVGENTTVVVNGDTDQKDIKGLSGLEDLIARVGGMPSVGHIAFEDDDIVRSGFVKDILTRYRRR